MNHALAFVTFSGTWAVSRWNLGMGPNKLCNNLHLLEKNLDVSKLVVANVQKKCDRQEYRAQSDVRRAKLSSTVWVFGPMRVFDWKKESELSCVLMACVHPYVYGCVKNKASSLCHCHPQDIMCWLFSDSVCIAVFNKTIYLTFYQTHVWAISCI